VVGGELCCLACRRATAGEQGAAAVPETTNAADRVRARAAAVVEFELRRDPERSNSVIARTCRTSVPAVAKARARIGIPAP
jgi:hypothetical protein